MSVPNIENIAVNLLTTINGVTIENGYNQDLSGFRPKRFDYSDVAPTNGTVLIVQDVASPVGGALSTEEWVNRFWLQAIVIDSDDASTPIDTRLNQVAADMMKAVKVDTTRGGYAIDTTIGDVMPINSEDLTVMVIAVDVTHREEWDDPYTQA